jgi:EAL domain-containing protein (putative c-di-GMP-specific phosphodiesterase class I)
LVRSHGLSSYGQGFLLSQPLSAEQIEVLLSEWNPSFAAPRDDSVTRA